jgi:hypothetical protein
MYFIQNKLVKYWVNIFCEVYSTRFVASYKVEESVNTSFSELKDAVARAQPHRLAGNAGLGGWIQLLFRSWIRSRLRIRAAYSVGCSGLD